MAPPKQLPGHASEGQYTCKRKLYRPRSGKLIRVCEKPVPAGELTYVSLNSKKGRYVLLCVEHRAEVDAYFEELTSDPVGAARLVSGLFETSSGQLISMQTMREALAAGNVRPLSKRGPMSAAERKAALRLLGAEQADPSHS